MGGEEVEQVGDDGGGDGGPGTDTEPQRGRGVEGGGAGGEGGWGQPGKSGGEDDDGPGVAAGGAVEPGGSGVGDKGEPVGHQRIKPGDPGGDAGGDGDLEQAVRGRRRRTQGHGQTG